MPGTSTFVLVPGAWLGSWAWKKVTPALAERGNEVFPVTLTGMGERVHLASKELGIETALQDVLNVLEYNDLRDVVLVGHSFAGKVVAAVSDRAPERIGSIMYVDAFRPEKVRTPQAAFDPSLEFGPLQPGDWKVPLTDATVNAIGKDVTGENRTWLMSKATPWPMKYATDPIVLSTNFDAVKSSYVFCRGSGDPVDDIIAGKWGKLEGPHRVIDSGHWPMITKPEELAADMMSLVNSL